MATKKTKKEIEDSMSEQKVEEYANNFNGIVFNGFISLAVALGNNLGLIDHLKSMDDAADAKTIATALKLNERYVQEWLGCMVAATIVEMEGEDKYFIPSQCKEKLSMALYAPCLPCMANREEAVEEMFRTGKGMEAYQDDMGVKWYQWQDKERFAFVDDRLDNVLQTLGKYQDSFKTALEVGCASGILSTALAKRNKTGKVYGIDIQQEAIARAKAHAQKENVSNVEFHKCDIVDVPADWTGKFDLVMIFDVLHDVPDPDTTVEKMKSVLTEDGTLMIIDPKTSSYHSKNVGDPFAAAFYSISMFNCLPQSLSSGPAAGLGACWGFEKEEEFLKSHGLKIEKKSDFTVNEMSIMFVCKKTS